MHVIFCHINGNSNINLPFPVIFKAGNISELKELYKELNHVWIEKGLGYKLKSRALFMIILHKLLTVIYYRNSKIDHRIKIVKDYIINNYSKEIDIKDLSKMVKLNHIYLGALFKRSMGVSIKDYIRRIRVNSAENLLLMGGHTVSEVAVNCGFSDVYYFSKLYKLYKGYPPSNLLKKDRKGNI